MAGTVFSILANVDQFYQVGGRRPARLVPLLARGGAAGAARPPCGALGASGARQSVASEATSGVSASCPADNACAPLPAKGPLLPPSHTDAVPQYNYRENFMHTGEGGAGGGQAAAGQSVGG